MSREPGVQLEDFNHAMLRAIYAFYLFFFILLAFTMGLALLPFGYLAALFIKIRLLYNNRLASHEEEVLMLETPTRSLYRGLIHKSLSLLLFFLIGWVVLFIGNIKDSLEFAKQCWKETPEGE